MVVLSAHGAVEEEVDGRIEQGEKVQDLSHSRGVAPGEKLPAEDPAQEGHDPLRDLRDEEEEENGHEHPGRPVRLMLVPQGLGAVKGRQLRSATGGRAVAGAHRCKPVVRHHDRLHPGRGDGVYREHAAAFHDAGLPLPHADL